LFDPSLIDPDLIESVQEIASHIDTYDDSSTPFDDSTQPVSETDNATIKSLCEEFLNKPINNRLANNIKKVIIIARKLLPDNLNRPMRIPNKTLKEVIGGCEYLNDRISSQYLAGILASSATEVGRDNRGANLARITTGLSSYQLRTHYLVYSTVSKLLSGHSSASVGWNAYRHNLKIFMPYPGYISAMGFFESEWKNIQIWEHIFFGLHSRSLIDTPWSYGSVGTAQGGITCTPSAVGAELFLWAFGISDKSIDYLLAEDATWVIEGIPSHVNGAVHVSS